MTIKGAVIAASVAGMFAMGASGVASAKEGGDDVMCSGINGCKGQGSCHGGGHSCAGMNGCKGQGNMKVSKAECKAKGGKVVSPEKSEKK
jgi:hypothetical protein